MPVISALIQSSHNLSEYITFIAYFLYYPEQS